MSHQNLETRVKEITSFLEHRDNDLARRRLLDLVYDTDDLSLLQTAVDWSKKYQRENEAAETWYAEARALCDAVLLTDNPVSTYDSNAVLIKAAGIGKTYNNGFFSLHPIPVQLFPGEIIGVVGENGNGKTTLLRCIAGQLATDLHRENFTYLKGNDNFFYDLKQHTGFIPQRIPRWYGKLQDNLHFTAAIRGIKGQKNDLMVAFILERFGLTKFANLTWSQISSGYRTRFEIARLVLQRPPVLILDEPLANLDIIAQQTLLQDLRFLAQSTLHPMGMILTSQQLFEVEKVADRVLFIQNGRGVYNQDVPESVIRVFEIETAVQREVILQALGSRVKDIRFNGGIFELETESDEQECLEILLENKIRINYFRNITHSAKRFF